MLPQPLLGIGVVLAGAIGLNLGGEREMVANVKLRPLVSLVDFGFSDAPKNAEKYISNKKIITNS